MIVGTAGHVDHGKTSLTRALTGIDTDRLPEEKARGITIELGFAHLSLPSGRTVGVVDVPGHEKFVRAMAAGAGGLDAVIFVVACDEGVMPQTREHLDICSLLGVRRGVIALTKSDLLPSLGEELERLVRADVAQAVAGTFLEGAPLCPVSARTGEGLPELKAALDRALADAPSRPADGPLHLPVDRAFSQKGFGAVVTGSLLSGTVKLDDEVSLLPGLPGPFRVRGLQTHGQKVPSLAAGARAAVNVAGVEAEKIARGMTLCRHGEALETRMLDVLLEHLPSAAAPLKKRQKLLLHLGTAQVEAQVALLDQASLDPGAQTVAQLRLGEPVVALAGQRFILRGFEKREGRGLTVAGGRVLAPSPRRRRASEAASLRAFADSPLEERAAFLCAQSGWKGASLPELAAALSSPEKPLARALEVLAAKGRVVLFDREARRFAAPRVLDGLCERALLALSTYAKEKPLEVAMAREELRQRLSAELDPKLFARVLERLAKDGRVREAQSGVALPGMGTLLRDDREEGEKLSAALAAAKLSPPTVKELARLVGLDLARVGKLLSRLEGEGRAVKVSEELYFHPEPLGTLRAALVAHLEKEKEISTQAFKDLTGQTRKYAIPLSEYFDREKVTLRVGEKRILRRSGR